MQRRAILAAALIGGAAAVPAAAHVTIHPNALPAGGFTRVLVSVPNERDKAVTRKVEVDFPSGFVFASYEPVPGWRATIRYRNLATPVKAFGETISREIASVTWSGGRIGNGQFQTFPLSLAFPDRPGATLTFKALQTYSNGEVVRWVGAPSADEPAPRVVITSKTSPVRDFTGVAPQVALHRSS